jgi:tRNA(fMet)-specific endonuclease VapC
MRYLLDTNICIAAMRRDSLVLQRLQSVAPDDCAISTITSYELFTGIEKCTAPAQELAKINLLLSTVHEIVFDELAARDAGKIRAVLESNGWMIGPYDVLLAGHARSVGFTLVTDNTAEFGRVSGLSLENWKLPPP